MNPADYQILSELGCDGAYVVYRARRKADGVSVLLKTIRRTPARSVDIEGLRSEHALLEAIECAGVPHACAYLHDAGRWWLVLEDAGGDPLSSRLAAERVDLPFFFHLALQLASILAELHRNNVIHARIQPGNLLVHPVTRELTVMGFTHALHGESDAMPPAFAPHDAAALAYGSPEQTGRINRSVDCRTDLYSLGVVFYELLTGVLPFRSTDPLELIHAHIAASPLPPAEQEPAVPPIVSQIVMKLLEKTAEARYQSARGLKADLEVCTREWNACRSIKTFTLGEQDVSDRFLIPRRLYGREPELRELAGTFARVCTGPAALTLVSGYSGVGKTSLIQELYGPIVRQRGYFVSGKFDQVARSVPYGALLQALRGLVQQLLTESEERLSVWRTRLATALGANAGVLSEVIPEIELIIGTQQPVAPLAAAEAQNRFRLVFQDFVTALAGRTHPLVVFLDDLQWADAASLALLQPLLTSPDLRFFYLIGAYRDNEVDAGHLVTRTVDALEAAGVRIDRIVLAPLAQKELTRFVGDCLARQDAEVRALARLVRAKTEGNPFFVIQFLQSLSADGLLHFDHEQRRWGIRIADIEKAPMTDNVIDLMSHKIGRLSVPARRVLTLAACIGNRFDLGTLAVVSQQTVDETAVNLREALQHGLVVAAANGARVEDATGGTAGRQSYAFLHDRVQQAAYAGLPEPSRQRMHLTVGRLLLERSEQTGAEDDVFDVVGHLNLGSELISETAERLVLARHNLKAGHRAKSSTAYQAALSFFLAGLAVLDDAHWSSEYALMFELQREAAECEYLCGRFEAAERRFEALLARARSAVDKAQIYALRVVQYENLSRYRDAAQIGIEGLALFGVEFPRDEAGKAAALEAEIRGIDDLLDGRSIESLVDLPELSDAPTRMVLRLLTDTWAPVYIAGDSALVALISARIVSLSIAHGNTEDSAYGYVTHAISVGPLRGEYRQAYEWGRLALLVNERLADHKRRAKIHQQFNAHVTLWRRPFQTCIDHAQEACRSGLKAGDFTYAGYGAMSEAWPALLICQDLDRFVRDYTPTLGLLRRIRTSGLAAIHAVMLGVARALLGRTTDPLSLNDADFDETAFVAEHERNPFFMTVYHLGKLRLALLHEDFPAAVEAARRARELGPWGRGTIWPVLLDFWGGLAATAIFADVPADEQHAYRSELGAARGSLEVLAANCAENFRCFFLLLDAEIMRIEGRFIDALERYEEAVRYARETQDVQQEALAQELCGRLWSRRGNETAEIACITEAYRCYRRWGAAAKLRQLEGRYSYLPPIVEEAAEPSLDAASVMKATHVLASEIVLEELLRKLMRIALENAGAQRGLFLEEKDAGLFIEAESDVRSEAVHVLQSVPLEQHPTLSHAVVHYVRKTGQSVVVGDAATDRRFAADPYLQSGAARSILCMPVVHQGQSSGIVYLENNLTTEAFSAERVRVLEVLATPAAIALENARLYRERTAEIERRSRAEQDLRAALSEVEKLKNRLEAENVYLQREIDEQQQFRDIIGSSPPWRAVLSQVEVVAATDATVLILGETGTGKELIARAIHERSRRSGATLVRLNCSAISAGLVESELFGHVKGAFTGAHDKRIGRFEIADGGTIFLDEIAELPLETQAKLLRVLQEQEFEPVGSSQTRRVDVRVIAATNRDPSAEIVAGRFRADLYYRLNVFPIRMPPLRERPRDIPALAAFFLQRDCQRLGRNIEGFTAEAMAVLERYEWPGNVRELQNVVERAAVLCSGGPLRRELLLLPGLLPGPPATRPPQPLAATAAAPASRPPSAAADSATLEEVEREHIMSVLRQTGGVIEGPNGAAKILDLSPSTTRFRMRKLGIRREDYAA